MILMIQPSRSSRMEVMFLNYDASARGIASHAMLYLSAGRRISRIPTIRAQAAIPHIPQ